MFIGSMKGFKGDWEEGEGKEFFEEEGPMGQGSWKEGGRTLTFTEWLWKSVTTISFLLFTATKWGPENRKWVLKH